MKKYITGVAIVMMMVVVSPLVASAQWTTSGLNIYNSNTGNVGIGTATPNSILNVKMSATSNFMRLDPYAPGYLSGMYMSDGNNPVTEFSTNSGNGNVRLGILSVNPAYSLQFLASNTEKMRLTQAGDLGINTTTPTAKLDVNGTAKISGNLKIGSSITSDGDICIGMCP